MMEEMKSVNNNNNNLPKRVAVPDRCPVTGWGLSQDGKFSFGYASCPGKRSSMEDFYETRIDGVDGETVGLFGVFDAIAVSRDHKPDQTNERQRIEDAGGFVLWAGTWRVGGVLSVSRAFGDRLLKQYVVADPEIKEEVVDGSLEFLILASDGLWDVVSNDEAVAMIKPIGDPEEAATKLLQEASRRGSGDNITCVVVRCFATQNNDVQSEPAMLKVSSTKS